MITLILRTASPAQLHAAMRWTSDNLHVPIDDLNDTVAVAYVCRHFEEGQLSGWDGFTESIGV